MGEEGAKIKPKKCHVLFEWPLFTKPFFSPTYLRTAFAPVDPKSVRIQSSCQYHFTLLGSTGAKAALRTLMKLTTGYDIIKCVK